MGDYSKFFARERASQIDMDFKAPTTGTPPPGRPSFTTDPRQPALSVDEANKVVTTKKAPKTTKESIEAKIAFVDYIPHGQLTICVITMFNGFMVHGVSAPASPANFDADVGQTYAYEDAFKQLWKLEGYLLREKISQGHE